MVAGRSRSETRRRLAEVGIDDPLVAQRYPFQLSGGCASGSRSPLLSLAIRTC